MAQALYVLQSQQRRTLNSLKRTRRGLLYETRTDGYRICCSVERQNFFELDFSFFVVKEKAAAKPPKYRCPLKPAEPCTINMAASARSQNRSRNQTLKNSN